MTIRKLTICVSALGALSTTPCKAQQAEVVQIQMTMPYSAAKLDPAVKELRAVCRAAMVSSTGALFYPRIPNSTAAISPDSAVSPAVKLADLRLDAQGTYSGTLTARYDVEVPLTFKGKPGQYECALQGAVINQSGGYLWGYLFNLASLTQFRVATPVSPGPGRLPLVKGSFTW